MTGHLSSEQLWALGDEGPEALPLERAHLETCVSCQRALDDITASRALVSLANEVAVPELPTTVDRRVREALLEKLEARVVQPWWRVLLTPRLAVVGVAGVIMVVMVVTSLNAPAHEVKVEPPVAEAPAKEPAPAVVAKAPEKRNAVITTASNAMAANRPAVKTQRLEEGSVVATRRGGSMWLSLPDGSKAGLTASSELTLTRLEDQALSLSLASGSVALVVPHRSDRVLTVTAGEVEVVDLGTRFVVTREERRVVVAVDEGVVEVKTPVSKQKVSAGQALSFHDGRVDVHKWEPAAPTPVTKRMPATPASKLGNDETVNDDEEDDEETPTQEPQNELEHLTPEPAGHDEWALPPGGFEPESTRATGEGSSGLKRSSKLQLLEEKVAEFGRTISGEAPRENRVTTIGRVVERGDCVRALKLVDAWLKGPVSSSPREGAWRRRVYEHQVTCLTKLGRSADAEQVKKLLEQ